MCNLRLPFEAQHYNALAMKILKGSYPSIMPTYSKQLRDMIASMLAKKPQDRPSIIDVLNKPFIRTRIEKYVSDLIARNAVNTDMDDIYLDTLREQALALGIVNN
jgi:serine/threonine protein kinase